MPRVDGARCRRNAVRAAVWIARSSAAAALLGACAAACISTPDASLGSPSDIGSSLAPRATLSASVAPSPGGSLPSTTIGPGGSQASVVPAALVGDWISTTSAALAGEYQRRVYRFHPHGVFEFWDEFCRPDGCSGGYEWGILQVDRNTLVLTPQTPSVLGPRAYPFEIAPDPAVAGGVNLRLGLSGGIVDVFYRP